VKVSAKIMRSYDYCHFEISMDDDVDSVVADSATNSLRLRAARLVDKAVEDYKKLKAFEVKRSNSAFEMQLIRNEVSEISKLPEELRTDLQKAKVKTLSDYDHQKQFEYEED